ncbi:hypothetical protein JCM17845_14240 [Iodidimonas gelatinilytica]|uniref:Uncharacterized protein n=1 Tax=Iodidimonas gelatinilytica TaxID=1236966 RepID=A0A5A7MXJ3_9PROT|nr:hypothetical protein [Iodidimonas gelatinilytica]GER00801.1 hypothetical protein JCM17845_14240 [Iodidimonas gelatinilytica]
MGLLKPVRGINPLGIQFPQLGRAIGKALGCNVVKPRQPILKIGPVAVKRFQGRIGIGAKDLFSKGKEGFVCVIKVRRLHPLRRFLKRHSPILHQMAAHMAARNRWAHPPGMALKPPQADALRVCVKDQKL